MEYVVPFLVAPAPLRKIWICIPPGRELPLTGKLFNIRRLFECSIMHLLVSSLPPPPTPESVATPLAVGAGSGALDAGVGVGKGSQLGGGRRCTNGREGHGQLTCRSGRVGVGEVRGAVKRHRVRGAG